MDHGPACGIDAKDTCNGCLDFWREEYAAILIKCALEMAVRHFPEEIRAALARVFDMQAATHYCESVHRRLQETLDYCRRVHAEAHALAEAVHRDIDSLSKRLDGLDVAIDNVAKKLIGF